MAVGKYPVATIARNAWTHGPYIGLLSGTADALCDTWIYDHVQDALGGESLPNGTGEVIAGTAAVLVLRVWNNYRKNTPEYRHKRILRGDWWMSQRTLRDRTGLVAARRQAATTRPSMTKWERRRAAAGEVGIVAGQLVSGPAQVRGRRVVVGWDAGGCLVLGEPGSRKSTFLGGVIADLPGSALIVSTKDEFVRRTAELRSYIGPVLVFDPTGRVDTDLGLFCWDLVKGCRNGDIAIQRATALMAAASGAGLQNADFWQGRGRALFTALLVAADLKKLTLRDVARWLQTENYSQPKAILEFHSNDLEESVLNTLRQMTESNAKAASGSAAQTASQILEFLSDPRIADALCPPKGGGIDLEQFIRENGTLYLVSGDGPAMAPIMSALIDTLTQAAKNVASQGGRLAGECRLDPPLALILDEIDKTLPSVPIDKMSAELRGWGVFTMAVVQNFTMLVKAWGQAAASAIRSNLQVHIVLALNDQSDREWYERRIGRRPVEQPRTANKQVGETPLVPRFPAEQWDLLKPGRAVIVPNKAIAGVVDIGHGWKHVDDVTAKRREQAAKAASRAPAEAGNVTVLRGQPAERVEEPVIERVEEVV